MEVHKKKDVEEMEGVFGSAKFYHQEGERYLDERNKDLSEVEEDM